jgi:hypothetical protein
MQTSLGNDRGTTMRPVVAKTTPKKQNTTEDRDMIDEKILWCCLIHGVAWWLLFVFT